MDGYYLIAAIVSAYGFQIYIWNELSKIQESRDAGRSVEIRNFNLDHETVKVWILASCLPVFSRLLCVIVSHAQFVGRMLIALDRCFALASIVLACFFAWKNFRLFGSKNKQTSNEIKFFHNIRAVDFVAMIAHFALAILSYCL